MKTLFAFTTGLFGGIFIGMFAMGYLAAGNGKGCQMIDCFVPED